MPSSSDDLGDLTSTLGWMLEEELKTLEKIANPDAATKRRIEELKRIIASKNK